MSSPLIWQATRVNMRKCTENGDCRSTPDVEHAAACTVMDELVGPHEARFLAMQMPQRRLTSSWSGWTTCVRL
jgi:hypothetical protein